MVGVALVDERPRGTLQRECARRTARRRNAPGRAVGVLGCVGGVPDRCRCGRVLVSPTARGGVVTVLVVALVLLVAMAAGIADVILPPPPPPAPLSVEVRADQVAPSGLSISKRDPNDSAQHGRELVVPTRPTGHVADRGGLAAEIRRHNDAPAWPGAHRCESSRGFRSDIAQRQTGEVRATR